MARRQKEIPPGVAQHTLSRVRSSETRRRQKTRRRPAEEAAEAGAAFAGLVRVMATLRGPHGCPWDRRQSHRTLRPYLIEETYEALDAIDRRDMSAFASELGDVLFQCVFHAELAAERGDFDVTGVIERVTAKLIRRHPHVFRPDGQPIGVRRRGGAAAAAAVVERWEAIKAGEQQAAGDRPGVLTGLPRALPALLRAYKIGSRAAAVGFDWPKAADVLDKIDEEVRELREAMKERPARRNEEMGDLLFSIANLARKLGIDAESSLREANDKFTRRFAALEAHLRERGQSVHAASPDEMERAWAAIKTSMRRRTKSARSSSSRPPHGRRSRE